ncbi:MAG: DCC1-like thiol-disulfide oxidoreductase family protein [Parashewanella sp.]
MPLSELTIIYDNDCPICQNFVLKRKLDQKLTLTLVNARELTLSQLTDYRQRGYDLNDGMIAKWQGQYYFGHQALQLILSLSKHSSWVGRFFERIYQNTNNPYLYKFLVRCRLLLLKILGKKQIP